MLITKDLLDAIPASEGLSRLNIHDSLEASLQVMVLDLGPSSDYPMHHHKTRSEFYWVIEGELEITLMESAEFMSTVCLNPNENPGFLMKAGVNHAVRNKSDHLCCRFLEIRPGPFDPSDNVMLTK